MASHILTHEGNEGCFKIHRNANKFELKFKKDKRLTILVRYEEYSILDELRELLYNYYGDTKSLVTANVYEVKNVAVRFMSKLTKGELEKVMDERVERHKEESPIASKIVIKKEKIKYPVPGDFIIFHGIDKTKNDHLGVVANVNGEDYFVFIETGASFIMEELADSDWRFATATVEAM